MFSSKYNDYGLSGIKQTFYIISHGKKNILSGLAGINFFVFCILTFFIPGFKPAFFRARAVPALKKAC